MVKISTLPDFKSQLSAPLSSILKIYHTVHSYQVHLSMSWANTVLCKDGTLQPIQCGLITKQGDNIVGLPLTHVTASVNIINVLAEITLCQVV